MTCNQGNMWHSIFTESNLHPSQQLIQDIVDNTNACVFVKEYLYTNGKYLLSNRQFARLCNLEIEAIQGKTDEELFAPEIAAAFRAADRQVLETGQPIQTEEVAPHPDGLHTSIVFKFPLLNQVGEIYAVAGIATDITHRKQAEAALHTLNEQLEERTVELQASQRQLQAYIQQLQQEVTERKIALQELKHAQAQLVQTEKMSSLGQLVGGVAHEINNPVNFISGNISYAANCIEDLLDLLNCYRKCCPNPSPEVNELSEKINLEFLLTDLPTALLSIQTGADRIRDIVLALRTFSRTDEAEVKSVNIHEGIASTLMILENRLKESCAKTGIQIVKEYGDLPLVECYAGQLNQVFMHIIANAIDALNQHYQAGAASINPEENPPTIWIRTALHPQHLSISIADNGPGISEEIQPRLFEPFFTTKPVGKGTGLGLSISYQVVVDRHGGRLDCISSPAAGTEFVIEIPLKSDQSPGETISLT
jgi:two-component system, NtrC family, sensor kinase